MAGKKYELIYNYALNSCMHLLSLYGTPSGKVSMKCRRACAVVVDIRYT